MKLPLLLTIAAASFLGTQASVPVRRTALHTQTDGTALSVSSEANGRYTLYATQDGIAVLPGADGAYYYAVRKAGSIAPSDVLAHESAVRTAEERAFVTASGFTLSQSSDLLSRRYQPRPLARRAHAAAEASASADGMSPYGQSGDGTVKSIGSPVIPIVMVDFPDRPFRDSVTTEKMTRFFNEEGYKDEYLARGSVRDYFVAQSGGLFTPRFEIVAKVRADKGFAAYGKDGEDGRIDPYVKTLVQEALDKASESADISAYKTDGEVPLVAVMYAGLGQHSSLEADKADYIWGQFNEGEFTADGGKTKVSSFLVFDELLNDYASDRTTVTNTQVDGIGLFCHEFGHALGLPDFYYTGSDAAVKKSLKTMGFWSIMDYGEYFYSGYRPTGYTAYERAAMGWLDIKELDEPQYAELYPYGTEGKPTAYVIRNPENAAEYYLLENRRKTNWTPRSMGEGMLVTHVDYDKTLWEKNTVNTDPDHQRMQIVPADNVKDGNSYSTAEDLAALLAGYKGDLFPGTTGAASLTDDTQPAATVYTAAGKLGRPIYNIKESEDGVISFSFRDPNISGIASVTGRTGNGAPAAYYTLGGTRLATLDGAAPGVYLVRTAAGCRKVVVK